jgi:ATP-dependent Clp protease ATP-binding subunit ClpB
MESSPTEIDELDRKVRQLKIEEAALKKEKTDEASGKLTDVQKRLAENEQELSGLNQKWQKQKELLAEIQKERQQIDRLRIDLEQAKREVDLNRAAEIEYGKIPEVSKNLIRKEEEWKKIDPKDRLIKQQVDEEDIAVVVSKWTSIPVSKMMESETSKLKNLENLLKTQVVGQDEAIEAVAAAVRRSRVNIGDQNRPIAVFLFLGPTGVGKTETAKALTEQLFDDKKALIRIDMSEYSESHSVARLIGAPPGYVGYEEGGQLTEAVRRKPYCVILLDEIEKAHPNILNLFLQVIDEGFVTDGTGRKVDFKSSIIIATSNAGYQIILEALKENTPWHQVKQKLLDYIFEKAIFRPEFINRFDATVVFTPLSKEHLLKIADLMLGKLKQNLKEKGIELVISQALKEKIVELGYDPTFGAREMRRVIQDNIENSLASALLSGDLKRGQKVEIEPEEFKLTIK